MTSALPRQSTHELFRKTSFLYIENATYIESVQARYQLDPASVGEEWRNLFHAFANDTNVVKDQTVGAAEDSQADALRATRESIRATMLIRAYRAHGHLHANLDPLGLAPHAKHEELRPSAYDFGPADLDRKIFIDGALGVQFATINELLAILRRTYCDTIGYEFMHICDPAQRAWIQERIEGPEQRAAPSHAAKRKILDQLIEVKGYERYLDKRFAGTKRFGLDGAEATIPALEQILLRGAELGVSEVVLGMAHRGRLNVLSQVIRKPHRAIFHEFKGGSFVPDEVEGSGDVKYHLGASSDRDVAGKRVHLSLTANPSHLEISDPVVLGKARAKQDQHADTVERSSVLPLLIHGDAAFAGQGVVAECFGLSGLEGYGTGGSLHFIINNQIGFTTDPGCSRSSPYPSDLAKTIDAPIFHVNGDDPEAVVRVATLAIEFRQRFHRPVVIDMFCFRLYGHNESDEPAFTQPAMYKEIRAHQSTLEIYGRQLIAEGVVTQEEIEQAKAKWLAHLDAEFEASETYKPGKADWLDRRWAGLTHSNGDSEEDHRHRPTAVEIAKLWSIGAKLGTTPEDLHLHPTVKRFVDARRRMIETGEGIDWATAEALAFGSLLEDGHPVRLSGQDSERGTFSQRHSALIDQRSGERYVPLNHIREGQARCEIVNSMLSEEAVLAFEYGYTLAEPNALVLWEAQFGDFANGAQVVFDQFLCCGERKWLRMSGLVCLLPHGYDGQGPEHSSARLERYLQSSAENNWQVANCTTPANYFHILRRQLQRSFRKPLILMTPKSLLRHRRCKSDLLELAGETSFQCILPDDAEIGRNGVARLVDDSEIRRVLLCSGKIYYDLEAERAKRGIDNVYLLRVEQLYPFPAKELSTQLARFPNADMIWCQEEPKNMGAWSFVEPYLEWLLRHARGAVQRSRYVGRAASASTATGQMSQHLAQLQSIMEDAFSA